MQHDCYGDALQILVSACLEHARNSAALLGVEVPPAWTGTHHLDHRTLQAAHDILAAAWRFRANTVQPAHPLDRPSTGASATRGEWLEWLINEVRGWHSRPELVRLLLTINAHQNRPEGYAAEGALGAELRNRFSDVPWNDLEARIA